MVENMRNEAPVLRMGIAGLGKAGNSFIPAFLKHPNIKLAAAATRNQERLDKFAQEFKGATYQTVEELCKSDHIDGIYIATPTELHSEHILMAAQHKKHIIVEKPLALTLEEANKLIEAVERNGVKMVVGHSHSFEPPIQKIREVVKSGEIGKVRMIHNWYFNDWIYRPRTTDELDTKLGGGVTFRQGSHQFDIIRLIGGGLLRSVRAMTGVWDPKRSTEGSHAVYLEFVDGTAATAVYSGYDHFQSSELTFGIGEFGAKTSTGVYAKARKTIKSLSSPEQEIALKSTGGYGGQQKGFTDDKEHPAFFGLTVVSCEKGDIRVSPKGIYIYGDDEKYEIQLSQDETGRDRVVAELYDAVVKERPLIHDGSWARANLEVCLAVLESAKERKEIYLSHQVEVADE